MGNQINSFSENMRKTITAQTNNLALLEAIQKSISTKDTIVTYDYENIKDGSVATYQLPSYISVNNRLKAVERNLSNLASGSGVMTLNDGSRRQIKLTNLPETPQRISGLPNPTMFGIDSNWFMEDMMFPGITVNVDLTGQIEDSADRVKVSRIILDSTKASAAELWNNVLSKESNIYNYQSLKALLAYNEVPYSEDIENIELPLVSNQYSGEFQIMGDPEIIDGNMWYQFDTIYYKTINRDGTIQENNNILTLGDRLAYNNSLFSIIAIDQNTRKVRLKIISGAAFPGEKSIFAYYQDPFRVKAIDIRVGIHEYNIIYIKGINEAFNLEANEWSDPIKFFSDELVNPSNTNMTLLDYYHQYVTDWGSQWIAEAKERRIVAYHGHIPNAPVLNAGELRVVQINTQVNAALDKDDIKRLVAEIEETKSAIQSEELAIRSQKDELKTITSSVKFNAKQDEIRTNTSNLEALQLKYTTAVKRFQTSINENRAVIQDPMYHIRGFFPIPAPKYVDEKQTISEEIIGFEIKYRYICEDNTGVQLNTFDYTDENGAVVTGTFTDWILEQSKLKQRVWNQSEERYIWQSENVADGSEININQIDIPITKGEKVEIKVRSISEAGYPDNPLKSPWSESIVVVFPNNLSIRNEIADLVQEANDDAMRVAIDNRLGALGVPLHLSDSVPNIHSVSGIYYNHAADNIAYEFEDNKGQVTTSSIQEKVDDLEIRMRLIEQYLHDQAGLLDLKDF